MESSIIERVKEIRNKNKVSQIEFANSLGVSASYIAGLEMGRNSLNQKFIFAVKEKYNISADWLLYGEHSTADTLNIDILKLVIALDNSNRFLLFYIKETIKRLEESTNEEDANSKEIFKSAEFNIVYEKILKLNSDKNKLYTSILEDVVIGGKSNFNLTKKIKRYSEINLELNNFTNNYFSMDGEIELIDLESISQLFKAK